MDEVMGLTLYSAINNIWNEMVIRNAYDLGLLTRKQYIEYTKNQLKLIQERIEEKINS